MTWLTFIIVFLFILAAAFVFLFSSPVWERRKKRNEDIDDIREILPGLDCGLCGLPNCRLYACDLVLRHGDPALCAPGGARCEAKLRAILGGDRESAKVAFVRCAGGDSAVRPLYEYDGRENCAAAASLFGGLKGCPNACLGFGSCVSACPFHAISLANGVARVDPELCSGCGKCISVCPHNVIALIPAGSHWQVACNSELDPAARAAICLAACTACGKCAKLSAAWEFSMINGLAKASDTVSDRGPRSGDWAAIASQCPTGAIIHTGRRHLTPQEPAKSKPKAQGQTAAPLSDSKPGESTIPLHSDTSLPTGQAPLGASSKPADNSPEAPTASLPISGPDSDSAAAGRKPEESGSKQS